MATDKKDLYCLIETFDKLVANRTRNPATATLFNSLNKAKTDMVDRLVRCVWNAEYALAKNNCAKLPKINKPSPDDCLKDATMRLQNRKTPIVSVKKKEATDLAESDFVFMQDNLSNARAMLRNPEVNVQLPQSLYGEPIIVLLLAVDPDKFLLNLPEFMSRGRFYQILNPKTSTQASFSELKENFIALQRASPRPTIESVKSALVTLQSDDLRSLFRQIAHDDYGSTVPSSTGGGKIINVLQSMRLVWSRFVVWILVMVVDLLDLITTSIHVVIFKPLTDCSRVLTETSRPDLLKQSNAIEALSTKIKNATSQALAKFGYRVSVYLLAADPNYAHRVFQGKFADAAVPLLPTRPDFSNPFSLNNLLFIPGMRKKDREDCRSCISIPLQENLLPRERQSIKTCSEVSVIVAGKITPTSYVVLYSHHRGEELNYDEHEYSRLSNQFSLPVVAYDYCGYGASTGDATESGCYQSVLAVCNWICSKYGVALNHIFSVGFSLGAAVGAYLAYKKPGIAGVVLVSPFTSLTEIMKVDIPGLNMFRTKNFIHKIFCPMLLIHGNKDSLISFQQSKTLYWLARRNNRFADVQVSIIDGMDHVFARPAKEMVRAFLEKHTSRL